MNLKGFYDLLAEFSEREKIPFRHYEFSEPTPAPCLVCCEEDGESIAADSVTVFDEVYMRAELYTRPEDIKTCEKFEEFLTENGLTYERDRAWISERHEVMYIYEIDL